MSDLKLYYRLRVVQTRCIMLAAKQTHRPME